MFSAPNQRPTCNDCSTCREDPTASQIFWASFFDLRWPGPNLTWDPKIVLFYRQADMIGDVPWKACAIHACSSINWWKPESRQILLNCAVRDARRAGCKIPASLSRVADNQPQKDMVYPFIYVSDQSTHVAFIFIYQPLGHVHFFFHSLIHSFVRLFHCVLISKSFICRLMGSKSLWTHQGGLPPSAGMVSYDPAQPNVVGTYLRSETDSVGLKLSKLSNFTRVPAPRKGELRGSFKFGHAQMSKNNGVKPWKLPRPIANQLAPFAVLAFPAVLIELGG